MTDKQAPVKAQAKTHAKKEAPKAPVAPVQHVEKPKPVAKAPVTKPKAETLKFKIDCTDPLTDNVITLEDFEDFLKKRIKVHGKKGNLGSKVSVTGEKNTVVVTAEAPFSKRYLKYLTKKYLKKNHIRDYLHVVAKDKHTYQIRYFNIQGEDVDEEWWR